MADVPPPTRPTAMLLDLMIPFHLRHPLEPLLAGSVISLIFMLTAFSLMSRAYRMQKNGRAGRAMALRWLAGPLIGIGAYLATMALVTSWVNRPYLELLPAGASLLYLAMGVAIGLIIALAPSRAYRIAAGAMLGAAPILTVGLRVVTGTGTMPDAQADGMTTVFWFAFLAIKAGAMTGVAAWLCASPSHIARAGSALFCTSALTITLSAVPAVLGQSRTVWSTSTGILTPYAAWSATTIVFILIACAIAEHYRLAGIERARRDLQRSQDRLNGLTKASFEGLIVHRDGLLVDWNERFCEMGQWHPFGHLPPAHVSHLIESDHALVPDHAPHETVLKCRDGRRMPVEILSQHLAPKEDDTTIVTAVRDLTQRKAQDAAIAHMARHDGLTDLLNRTAFHHDVERLIAGAGRGALVLIDLDHFKPVNDTHGHPAGDHVLKVLARRFAARLREDDRLARLGGDEFAVFVADPAHAQRVAERLVAAACEPIALPDTAPESPSEPTPDTTLRRRSDETERTARPTLTPTRHARLGASAGVATFPGDADTFDRLLGHADAALYQAKSEGRGRVCRYDVRLHACAEERVRMVEDLRAAIAQRNLSVAYQPIFEISTGETIALEALVRWTDLRHGDVEPDVFLPLAEEARLMPALGRFVMEEAFATAARTGLRICVNVAPQQIAADAFLDEVDAALEAHAIDPTDVELEVTERMLRQDDPIYLERLQMLSDRGFHIALDDFGTGPSALSALQRYPFGRIKLDGGFLRGMDPERAPDLLAAIVALARVQRLQVTAEGIESHAELALMTRAGLDAVQGYLLARPGAAERVRLLLGVAA